MDRTPLTEKDHERIDAFLNTPRVERHPEDLVPDETEETQSEE